MSLRPQTNRTRSFPGKIQIPDVSWDVTNSPLPWSKGRHPDYDAFVIEIHVRKGHDGSLQSFRILQDQGDESVAQDFGPSGGLEEGALALLTEAAKAEIMLQTLVRMSNDPDFQEKLKTGNFAGDFLQKNVVQAVQHLSHVLDRVVPSLVEETMRSVADEIRKE